MQDGSTTRIFLRDSETGEFYQGHGRWVANPEDAAIFETQSRAIEMRAQLPKEKIEMLVIDERGRVRMGINLWKGIDFPMIEDRDSSQKSAPPVRRASRGPR